MTERYPSALPPNILRGPLRLLAMALLLVSGMRDVQAQCTGAFTGLTGVLNTSWTPPTLPPLAPPYPAGQNFPPTAATYTAGGNTCAVCPSTFSTPVNGTNFISLYLCAGNLYTFSLCLSNPANDFTMTLTQAGGAPVVAGSFFGNVFDNDGCGSPNGPSTFQFSPQTSQVYRVRFLQDPCTPAVGLAGTLTISCTIPPPPANDQPCAAEPLSVGTSCVFEAGLNTWATNTLAIPNPSCGTYTGRDVWYSAVVPASGNLAVQSALISANSLGIAAYLAPPGGCAVPTVTTPSNYTIGLPTITVTNAAGIVVGAYVTGAAFPPGTTVISVVGTTVTVSANATANGTLVNVQYGWGQVQCSGALPPSLLMSNLPPGATLYIRAWSPNNLSQMGTYNICAFEPVPPQNDNPCGALNMPTPATCTPGLYNTQFATPTSLPGLTITPATPTCGGAANADVWFEVTVPASGAFTVNTFAGTLTDMAMAWYRLSPGGSVCNPPGFTGTLTQIACNDNQATGNNMPRINSQTVTPNIFPALVPGETIYVRVWPQGALLDGTFELCVTESVPPPNDNPCGAIALLPSLTCNLVPTTNESANLTLGVPVPPCGAPVQNDVWYSAVVPPNGQLEFNTQAGTLTDAAFALYQVASGSCATSNLTLSLVPPVNCQVGGSSFGVNMPQQLFAGLTPGSTVYLRVWRQTGAVGSFNICARATAAAPITGCDITNYDSGGPTGSYGNNEIYEQTFCPEFPGDVVSLAWIAFSTQANTDFMTIYNGPSVASPVLGTYSGGTLPPGFVSTHPQGCLTIRFTSNASVVSNGWALSVSCGPPMPPAPAISGVCGTTVYDPGGASGNYTNSLFVTNTYCPTTPGEVITLTFTQFATEQNFDFVTIFNGPDAASPILGTFSGTNLPGTFISTHPTGCLTVRFTSDISIVSAGYAATIRCGPPQPPPPPPPPPTGLCGTQVFDPGGATGNYFNATNQNPANQGGSGCWDPPGPQGPCAPAGPYPPPPGTWGQYWSQTYCPDVAGDAVTLAFSAFALENGWDNLYVYNGPTVDPYNVNGTQFLSGGGLPTCGGPPGWCNQTLGAGGFTGNVIPGPFTSTHPSGCITIAMTSDDIVNLAGWAATVQCQSAFNPNADCIYALRMYDIFGDGWAGSSITVTINGGSPSTYTIEAGTFNEVLIGLDAGDNIAINYSGVGYFPTDNYWTFDLVGETYSVFHSAIPAVSGTFNFTANCLPPEAPPQDCMGADIICTSGAVLVGGTHAGSVGDMIAPAIGCLTNEETEGNWYAFSTTAAGNLGLTITPTVAGTNLDFALWGPFPFSLGNITNWSGACQALSFTPFNTPLRCSFATATAAGGATGLNGVAVDASENAGGDQWVQQLTVAANQVYMLYISNASRNNSAANITFSNTSILTCGFILPVELLEFDAKAGEAHVDVTWSTASEQNSAYFKVQRSSDGLEFHTIGHVQAAGNSQSRLDYLFKDESPLPGVSFYRLEQVVLDGSSTLSQMVPVEFNGRSTRLAIYPNPTRDVLNVTYELPGEGVVTWTVVDQSGRRVMSGTLGGAKGSNRFTLDAQALEAGAYQLDVLQGGTPVGRARFIKQ